MDDKMFDFPFTEDFTDSTIDNLQNFPQNEKFYSSLSTNFYYHLRICGVPGYGLIPRSINECYYTAIFEKFINCENKAGIVYILHKPQRTWVYLSVCVASKNNYYALTYMIEEDTERLSDEEIYNKTIEKGIIANVMRYKLKEDKSKL